MAKALFQTTRNLRLLVHHGLFPHPDTTTFVKPTVSGEKHNIMFHEDHQQPEFPVAWYTIFMQLPHCTELVNSFYAELKIILENWSGKGFLAHMRAMRERVYKKLVDHMTDEMRRGYKHALREYWHATKDAPPYSIVP